MSGIEERGREKKGGGRGGEGEKGSRKEGGSGNVLQRRVS